MRSADSPSVEAGYAADPAAAPSDPAASDPASDPAAASVPAFSSVSAAPSVPSGVVPNGMAGGDTCGGAPRGSHAGGDTCGGALRRLLAPGGATRLAPSRTTRNATVVAAVAVLLVTVTAAALTLGASSVSLPELASWLTGGEITDTARGILENVRIPRVLAALLAGAALATSGALIQACLDNPLASPNVIGVNSGAGLFVLLAASLAPGALWLAPLAAFAGALATALIVFALSLGTGLSRLTVVLAGIAITTVFGAGMNTILIVDPDAYVGSSTFLVGGLSGVLMRDLGWPAAYVAVGLVAAFVGAAKLNVLSLGDEAAHSLGVNVRAVRLGMLAAAAVLAGAAVSFAGLIGFVGLVVPHLMRFFVGHDNRWVVPASALAGAAFVVGCDLLARVLFAPYELPVGILLAFIGGPFFIYLILKNKGGGLD